MSASIASLMERKVITVSMDDTAAEVERLFADAGLSWAPVLDSGQIAVGVISATDLLQLRAQDRDAQAMKAWQLCTYKPIVVAPDAPLCDVARLMVETRIHHVVVMEGERIAGVVSSLDFVRAFVRS